VTPPALQRKSGITKTLFFLNTSSASGVVGPLAPSAIIFTDGLTFSAVSPVSCPSSAAGIKISTSCSNQALPSVIS